MRKAFGIFTFLLLTFSNKRIEEISDYVLENIETLSSDKEMEFFIYEATGLITGGVYYGYYYTSSNKVAVPDFYGGNLDENYEDDGGTYWRPRKKPYSPHNTIVTVLRPAIRLGSPAVFCFRQQRFISVYFFLFRSILPKYPVNSRGQTETAAKRHHHSHKKLRTSLYHNR